MLSSIGILTLIVLSPLFFINNELISVAYFVVALILSSIIMGICAIIDDNWDEYKITVKRIALIIFVLTYLISFPESKINNNISIEKIEIQTL